MTAQERLDQMIDDFDTAMLISRSLEGKLRARPMAVAGHDEGEGGLLYFATRSGTEKLDEIRQAPDVAVTFQDDNHFLSISGEARMQVDPQLARKLWSPAMKIWFPDGPEDPRLALIVVDPDYAEFWDNGGLDKLEFLWEAGKAIVKGEAIDDSYLSGNAKVKTD